MTTKAESRRLGGLATVRKHAREHMAKNGAKGTKTLWQRYRLVPCLTKFVLIDKETGEVKAVR
jgi:hypothetical protein